MAIISPQGPPNADTPITGKQFLVTLPWLQFFTSLVSRPPAAQSIAAHTSPASFTASQRGSLLVRGGTVSAVTLTRGRDTFATGLTAGFFPMSQGDAATIMFTVPPTLTFLAG